MKRILAFFLAFIMLLSLVACNGSKKTESEDDTITQDTATEQYDTSTAIDPIISKDELYGVYVSALDENVTYIFTEEEITLDVNKKFLTSPVYRCRRGEEKVPIGVYSLEIEGNILTVVDWHGGIIPFEILKDDDNLKLKFLEEQFDFSSLDHPDSQSFLSDLTKEGTK